MTRDRGGGRDARADEVRAPALALTPLEVAVARGGAAFPRRQDVRVHAEAHRAARPPPLEPGGLEDLVQALLFGLDLHRDTAGHDERPHALADRSAAHDVRRDPEILDPRVRARS